MESFFLEVNENIETHVAEEKKNKKNTKQNKQLINLIDKNLVFVRVQPNEHVSCDMLVSTKAQQEPIRNTGKPQIFTPN